MAHKGLNSPERFTNLPLGLMPSILNEMGLMYVFLWVPWSLSESKVFKFTKYVERNKMHFCP